MFAKLYLSPEIDGKPNEYFGKGREAGIKAGYSESYAGVVLARIQKRNSVATEMSVNVKKSLATALEEKGLNSDWMAQLSKRLGEKNSKAFFRGKFFDSGDPDSFAARTVLDFIAKTQGLYADEKHKHSVQFDGFTKEQLIEFILGTVKEGSRGNS